MKLKSKFSFLISLLIILVIGATAAFLVQQEKTELEHDIYLNTRSFGELTAEDIVGISSLYLPEENFIPFKRDLTEILKKNADVSGISIYSFAGQVVYDQSVEANEQYSGPERTLDDDSKLTRVKSSNISLINDLNEIFYLEKKEAGVYSLTDENGKTIPAELTPDLSSLKNIIVPVNNEFAVEYRITYQNLTERLIARAQNIAMIAAVGVLISVIFALILASIVTTPISKLSGTVAEIAKGDFKKRSKVKSKDEVGDLADSVNRMARDLEKATEAKIYQERVKKELEIAGEIQKNILPDKLLEISGIDVAAELIPATEVGGDVYDVMQDAKGDSYFYVGDVTGHGVPAGLLSALTNAVLTSTIDKGKLEEIMYNLNRVLRMKTPGNLFLTLLLMKFSKTALEYISAGHEQVIHFSAKDKKVSLEEAGGIALAMVDDVKGKFVSKKLKLAKGDVVLMYTDGIPEAWKNSKEQYGMDKLKATLEKVGHLKSANEIKTAILDDVKSFMGKYEQKDDITLIVLKKS